MADTPDLSKIISVIMDNPAIIEQISALIKSEDASDPSVSVNNDAELEKTDIQSVKTDTPPMVLTKSDEKKKNRTRLLYAMKPYLKESRTKAIDTMISIADILDVMRGD